MALLTLHESLSSPMMIHRQSLTSCSYFFYFFGKNISIICCFFLLQNLSKFSCISCNPICWFNLASRHYPDEWWWWRRIQFLEQTTKSVINVIQVYRTASTWCCWNPTPQPRPSIYPYHLYLPFNTPDCQATWPLELASISLRFIKAPGHAGGVNLPVWP